MTKDQKTLYNKTYYLENKEKLKEAANSYYQENKDHVLTVVHEYREANRETIRDKGKLYYRRNVKNRLLNAARARSKKSGCEFNLTIDDFEIPETCPLLGIPLFVAEGRKSVKSNSASLDRKDSSRGYTKDNVWIISFKANTMKSNSTIDEFVMMADNWKRIENL